MSHNTERRSHEQAEAGAGSEYELLPRTGSPLPPPQESPPDPGRFQAWWWKKLDTWLFEILAMIFSLTCCIAIVCILVTFNGEPQPEFAYGLTLNAIISTLATASKSSLIYVISACIGQLKWIGVYKRRKQIYNMELFDSASRGPLGAIFMVLQDKGRSLVSLGAVLTILALIFDPFVQQVLTYRTLETVEAANSSLAIAKREIVFDDLYDQQDRITPIGVFAQASEYLQPIVTCPSGNCEWDEFESVGLCSQCEDITSQTTFKCPELDLNSYLNFSKDVPYTTVYSSCRLVPPQGQEKAMNASFYFRRETNAVTLRLWIYDSVIWPLSTGLARPGAEVYMGIESPAVVVAHANLTLVNTTNIGLPRFLNLEKFFRPGKVTQCALALCSRKYNVSVSNGTALFNISSPDYGRVFENSLGSKVNVSCWKPSHGASPESINFTLSNTYNRYINVSEGAFCGVGDYTSIPTYLQGYRESLYKASNTSDLAPSINTTRVDQVAANRILDVGLESVMSNIADTYIKYVLDASNVTVNGDIKGLQVYVFVHWAWLVLPCGLVVLGAVFLGLTILLNSRQRLRPWRTSVLAVLFHGLHGPKSEAELTKTDTAGQMEQVAQNIHVRLRRVDSLKGLVLDRSA
ncbi:DUF3176 domain-containing protein [Aspergillus mulundensis]|uniref:Uncharacterized protein n=1 Tax=Aspergillus mulundensis TaxID=1810919 RepID=A0A3D8SX15_9EURO|nr:hypothetical protein DSM5745_02628 [Aspergillus mulundensis]RDW90853.1 hypothetical protein DSM5745_02628 [Aspergillus mulundensis]